MGKVFIKMNDSRYEKVDKVTGEITELKHTLVLDEESWFKVYSNVFCSAISEIKSLIDVKVFAVCLKCSIYDEKYGNIIETGDRFKRNISEFVPLKQPALSRSLKGLCDAGLLNRLSRSTYQIHPQIAYCGDKHSRAKLIFNIIHEPTDKIL